MKYKAIIHQYRINYTIYITKFSQDSSLLEMDTVHDYDFSFNLLKLVLLITSIILLTPPKVFSCFSNFVCSERFLNAKKNFLDFRILDGFLFFRRPKLKTCILLNLLL